MNKEMILIKKSHQPYPIIIDTDFGGDPDDAIALVYALHSPELDLRAIITNDEYLENHRALLLKKWLNAGKKDVPLFSGKDLGNRNLFLLDDFVSRADVPSVFQNREMGQILNKLAKDSGYYISIGGLSNLAYLQEEYPNLWSNIKVTIMGGAIHYRKPGIAEHNVRLDLKAAHKIFNQNRKQQWILSDHTFVPQLTVTRSHKIYSYFKTKKDFFHRLVLANMNRFFDTMYPDTRLHDPLTISSTFLPTVQFVSKKILFSKKGEFTSSKKGKPTIVSKRVDYEYFWKDIYSKLN